MWDKKAGKQFKCLLLAALTVVMINVLSPVFEDMVQIANFAAYER